MDENQDDPWIRNEITGGLVTLKLGYIPIKESDLAALTAENEQLKADIRALRRS